MIVVYYNITIFNTKCNNNDLNYQQKFLCLLLFFFIIYLYLYGYYANKYCFSNSRYSCFWHLLLHFLAFTGHNILILS